MDGVTQSQIISSDYRRADCAIGIVHLGFGAFHRAHQAVYIDEYMAKTNDLAWGIAAVNLRHTESQAFALVADEIVRHDGYLLKSVSPDNQAHYTKIRSHIAFSDWAQNNEEAEALVSQPSVKAITITVTESGYYTNPQGDLDLEHPVIAAELQSDSKQSVYAFLRAALATRKQTISQPITISCCDNIRQNGKMLERNMTAYLVAIGDTDLAQWMASHVAFPCSMVDRITPRSPDSLRAEMSAITGSEIKSPILCEDYIEWVLADNVSTKMPDLAQVGVTITADVDPYEETKIRVLNGGHTALAYMAALQGIETFDAAMRDPYLRAHFDAFETEEVLPAITIPVPFEKKAYQLKTAFRFCNQAIGDTVARICADGMAKFPIFIRPTLQGCFAQNIMPRHAILSIASWYIFACHVKAGRIPFDYIEPSWDALDAMLGNETFFTSEQLWGSIPQDYPEFVTMLKQSIAELGEKWPV